MKWYETIWQLIQKYINKPNNTTTTTTATNPELYDDELEKSLGFSVRTCKWLGNFKGPNSKITLKLDKVVSIDQTFTYFYPAHHFSGDDNSGCDGVVCCAWRDRDNYKWVAAYWDYKPNAEQGGSHTYDSGQLQNLLNNHSYDFHAKSGDMLLWFVMSRDCKQRSNALTAPWTK
jgi:hypothetical protein